MAKSDSTSNGNTGTDANALRAQRSQAEQAGDTARVADLDRQIRAAEQSADTSANNPTQK